MLHAVQAVNAYSGKASSAFARRRSRSSILARASKSRDSHGTGMWVLIHYTFFRVWFTKTMATCPCCLDEIRTTRTTVKLPCCSSSVFHNSCFQRLALNQQTPPTCPLCRAVVPHNIIDRAVDRAPAWLVDECFERLILGEVERQIAERRELLDIAAMR